MPRINYLLEIERDGKLWRSFALPPVESYETPRDYATELTWTLGDDPVREHSGLREGRITLRGQSGFKSRLGTQWQRDGAQADLLNLFASGPRLFREFERFLEGFQDLARDGERGGSADAFGRDLVSGNVDFAMVFRALEEQHEWYVEPVSFVPAKSLQSHNLQWQWELQLRAYKRATPKRDGSLLGGLADHMRRAGEFLDGLTLYVARAENTLEELDRNLDTIKEPIRAAGRMVNAVRELTRDARSILALPGELIEEVYHVTEASTLAVFEAWELLGPEARAAARPAMYDALSGLAEVRRGAVEVLGGFGLRLAVAGVFSAAAPRAAGPMRTVGLPLAVEHELQPGETLADVAEAYLGDRSAWPTVARLNDMTSAWTLPDGTPLSAGDVILAPAPAVGGGLQQGHDGDIWGTDLLLRDKDLVLVGNTPTDFASVSGPNNYRQALQVRLGTVQGDSAVWPTLGLPRVVGEPSTAEQAGLVASHARSQLLADRRTAGVEDIVVTDAGPSLLVDAVVRPVSGPRLPVRYAVR